MSVVCGHNKTFDNLCHLGCGDAKSESERAREQESKRARKRASERARAKERGRERESPWVLGREPIVSLLLAREKERERERTHRRRLWTREKVCVCECVCEREKQKGREREVSCMQNNQYSDYTLSAFRIARPFIENYSSLYLVHACMRRATGRFDPIASLLAIMSRQLPPMLSWL